VRVIWGASTGLGTGRVSVEYTQADFGETVRAGDQFGYSVDALEDVAQDGAVAPYRFTLAIGVPGGDVGSDHDAGWVGTLSPMQTGTYADFLTQDSPSVPDSTEPGDRFGTSVSLGYFLGNPALADLAVGSPQEDVGSVVDAGTVTIVKDIYVGSDGGVVYDQDSAGVASIVESGDRFGYSLDSMRTGGTTRLAVGVPYEDVGSAASAGLVQLFSANGSTVTAGVGLTQNTAGVLEVSQTGDLFGERVAWARPGLGDTATWLAVGVPSEDGIASNTGLVQLFPMNNLAAERNFSQSSPGIPGNAQAGELFGSHILQRVHGVAEEVTALHALGERALAVLPGRRPVPQSGRASPLLGELPPRSAPARSSAMSYHAAAWPRGVGLR
jgi:hypothetical protein